MGEELKACGVGQKLSKRLNYLIQVAGENAFNVVPGFFDAVIGDAILQEIVGSYFFRAISGANLFAAGN